jgi:hypothetical protein
MLKTKIYNANTRSSVSGVKFGVTWEVGFEKKRHYGQHHAPYSTNSVSEIASFIMKSLLNLKQPF